MTTAEGAPAVGQLEHKVAALVDSLRHRPVATTGAQMREAADLLERAMRLGKACIALNQLEGADTATEQMAEPDASVVREYRAAVAALVLP